MTSRFLYHVRRTSTFYRPIGAPVSAPEIGAVSRRLQLGIMESYRVIVRFCSVAIGNPLLHAVEATNYWQYSLLLA